MPHRHRQLRYATLALALSTLLVGCDNNEYFITQPAGGGIGGGDNSGSGNADGSFSYTDLRGDFLPGTVGPGAPDILDVSGRFDGVELAIDITFAEPVVPWILNADNSLDGFLDLDLDGNPSTGVASAVDDQGGDAGLGVDYYLALRSADGTSAALVNPVSKTTVLVPATILENTLAIRVDQSAIRGITAREIRFALVAGNPASAVTDYAPNRGYWSIPVP